ncbi:MAG: dCMP deaminase [Pseudonocardiaceae bacterium]|nr:dCMP deaminase [Pseudonocardiaceae bacterium]
MAEDHRWLRAAVELSRQCPPAREAFSVGAIVVDAHGRELSSGYSRETDEKVHAEESALSKLDRSNPALRGATMYSSMEPCSTRKSRPRSCTQLILDAGIPRVVFALREPPIFVDCEGAERLASAGVTVVELTELADAVRTINQL